MKWFRRILLGLIGLVLLAVAVVWFGGSRIFNRTYESEPRNVLLSSRPELIAEGERLARVFGCFQGCHADKMQGQVWMETPLLDHIVTPDLTAAVKRFSPTELEAIVRQGVLPDGRSVFGMPSSSFASMTDTHLSAILSFIRQYPAQESGIGHSRYGLMARYMVLSGEAKPEAAERNHRPWTSQELQDPLRHGEYLALNACSECHGLDFEGYEGFSPPLEIAKAYDAGAFTRLMREGIGVGDRELGLMSEVARGRFVHMSDEEIEHLHRFLQRR